ncbi:MAG: hypothetical protein IKJ14_02345 [Clostridia bacterium]|nr:hypothetical protein [Clostridia bacterium]
MSKKSVVKKTFKIISNVVLYLFIALCVFGVLVSVSAKKNGEDAATIFGYQMRFVLTESMEKCDQTDVSDYKIKQIRQKSLIFVKTMPKDKAEQDEWYRDLKVGDVLTFKYVYASQVTITHRIVEIYEKPTGGFIIHLEGDNKNSDGNTLKQMIDTSIPESPNYVIGKVTGVSYLLGLFVYALKSPVGIICIVILPCVIIMILEIVKLITFFGAEKRKKQEVAIEIQQSEIDKQQDEIELLKKQLEELKKLNKVDVQVDAQVDTKEEN